MQVRHLKKSLLLACNGQKKPSVSSTRVTCNHCAQSLLTHLTKQALFVPDQSHVAMTLSSSDHNADQGGGVRASNFHRITASRQRKQGGSRHTADGLQIAFAISRKLMASTDEQISISHPGIRFHSSFQLRNVSCGKNEDNARFMSLVSPPQLDRDAAHLPEPAGGLLVTECECVFIILFYPFKIPPP